MCTNSKYGGLGLVDISLKNRVLLNKWIWRYGEELGVLWRSVIDDKYGRERNDLMPYTGNYKRFSRVWRNITKPLFSHNSISATVAAGFGFSLGDGSKICFWQDDWTNRGLLCNIFPRIFALSTMKDGKVKEFGSFIQGIWT